VADVEVLEFGEVRDGQRDRTNEVGDAGEREVDKGREVSYRGWKGDRFGKFEIEEIEDDDTVCWGEVVTCNTSPCTVAAVCGWIP
jgi:hypothetical protein